MNQAVISFASATARDANITSPLEGQLTWLEDVNKYTYYNGTAWTDLVSTNGANAIINGAFDIWQRGTTFSSPSTDAFSADRFAWSGDGSGATRTISQQTFTPGTAPVSGYESAYFLRYAQTVAGTGATYLNILKQRIEDVRTLAGQTVTVSFWAKADATRTITPNLLQWFGSGGSSYVTAAGSAITLTTSWVRYSQTYTLGSMSGKTIGTGNYLELYVTGAVNTAQTIDIWGVQLEAGTVATPFKRSSPTLQAELAACQRYYWRQTSANASDTYYGFATGFANSTTSAWISPFFPVPMRVAPSLGSSAATTFQMFNNGGIVNATSVALGRSGVTSATINIGAASGLTTNSGLTVESRNTAAAYLEFNAEL